jgi:O-antigen ligase
VTTWVRAYRFWLLVLAVGGAIGLLAALVAWQPVLMLYVAVGLAVPGVLALVLALLFLAPEILFALYMSVGSFKTSLLPLQERLAGDFTVALAILVIAGIIIKVLRRRDRVRLHWLILSVYLLLVGWMCLSMIWSPAQGPGWEKSARFATLTLLAFAAPMLLLDTWSRLERFLWVLFLAGMLFTVEALRSLYLGGELRRVMTVFGADYLTLGRTCGLAAGLGTYFLVGHGVKWWWRLMLLVCVGAAIFVLFLSASRGPIVAWLLAFVPPVLLSRRRGRKSLLILGIMLIGVILLGVGWALGLLPYGWTWRFEVVFAALLLAAPWAISFVPRIHIWQVGLHIFFQHPIFGAGVQAYRTSVPGGEVVYPHNLFLEAGAELGIVGLMLTLWLVIMPLVRWRQCSMIRLPSRYRFLFDTVLWVYAFFFIEVMKSGDFNSNRTFWMSVGAVMSVCTLAIGYKKSEVRVEQSGYATF